MKNLGLGLVLALAFQAQGQTILTYKYLKSPQSEQKSITLQEVQQVYTLVKRQAFLYPPEPKAFFQDYLRFRLGVESALNTKSLVKSPQIDKLIVSPFLQAGFHQELYKAFAEANLKKDMKRLERQTKNLSNKQLQNIYNKSPQYRFSLISVQHPVNPSKKQIKEASNRANSIYAQVKRSKKPFYELVEFYSDSKQNSLINQIGTKATILPQVYQALRKLPNSGMSKPIKVPLGFAIVKRIQKVPYLKTVHERPIKENYFAEKRTQAFNAFMDRNKRNFKVNYTNKALIRTLK